MKVYGQLEFADIHNLGADPAAGKIGRLYWNTATAKAMLDDGTNILALLRNDQKIILGTSATAAQNIRLNRAAAGVLQFVTGDDTTAQGTLSTSLAQISAKQENYTFATLPAAGNAGRIAWVTDQSKIYIDTGAAWKAINPITTEGDLIIGTGVNTFNRLAIGAQYQSLIAGATTAAWGAIPLDQAAAVSGALPLNRGGTSATTKAGAFDALSPMTTGGDIIYGGASGTGTRLGNGSAGQVLTSSGGTAAPTWTTLTAPGQNFLYNSNFNCWQRGTAIGLVSGTSVYVTDRWYVKATLGTSGVVTGSRVTGTSPGARYGLSVLVALAPTAAFSNVLELYQTLDTDVSLLLYNKTASFSIQVKAAANVTQVGVQFFYKTVQAKVDTAIGSEVLTTVNSSTFVPCTINGQALGTSQTLNGSIGVRIRATAVSSGNIYDLNNGFTVEQAMLNLGATAAAYAPAFLSPGAELAACKYFFQAIHAQDGINTVALPSGFQTNTTTSYGAYVCQGPMKNVPQISVSSQTGLKVNYLSGSLTSTAFATYQNVSRCGFQWTISHAAGGAANGPVWVTFVANTDYIWLDGEI